MDRFKFRFVLAALAAVVLAGCATAGGAMLGAGIGHASGNTTSGVLIGAGIGMMIDTLD
jgi:hypothetical protein